MFHFHPYCGRFLCIIVVIFPYISSAYQISNSDPNQWMKRMIEAETRQKIIYEPIAPVSDDHNQYGDLSFDIIHKVMYVMNLSEDCSRPLHQVVSTKHPIPPSPRGAVCPKRRKNRSSYWWPLFDDDPEYWFNHRIHSFGNTGWLGGLHAMLAPLATKIIDERAYGGMNVRAEVNVWIR